MDSIKQARILDLCAGGLSKSDFLEAYGIARDQVATEVSALLNQAILDEDSSAVESAFLVGFTFNFPDNIVGLIHLLLPKKWHISHENMIGLLQERADSGSVQYIKEAIALKPMLEYLEYDDYGSYYKKCLWALQSIGTNEALSLIQECANSGDLVLKEQAKYRLSKI